MNGLERTVASTILLLSAGGCFFGPRYEIKYTEFCKNRITPTNRATYVHGSVEEAITLFEQAQLPHNNPRMRFELERRAGRILMMPLASYEYLAIGEVSGGGNAHANLNGLLEAMCKRAALNGGDVILVFNSGIRQRPFSITMPSYAHTTSYGSAYRAGNYVYGRANAHTTYTPGQTVSGVHHLPYANAVVFRHVPGIERKRERLAQLDDHSLKTAMDELNGVLGESALTLDQALGRWNSIVGLELEPRDEVTTQPMTGLDASSPE